MKLEDMEVYIPNKKPPSNFKDLTGTENEYFKFISRAPNSSSGRVRWNCQCKICNDYCVKEATNLHRDKGCGCNRKANIGKALRKDLSEQRFGNLIAKKYSGKSNSSGNAIWICECDCGNICEVDSNNLISLHTTSCGCVKYSIGAKKINDILINNQINFITEYAVLGIGNYEKYPYRFDFALVDNNQQIYRLIEYDGIQHYMQTWGTWKTTNSLEAQQERDNRKNKWAIDNNIPLVRIPYWERDKITLEMILGSTYEVREVGQPTG